MIVAGSGTRRLATSPTALEEVIGTLSSLIREHEPAFVISGMAEGFDEAVAKAAWLSGIPFWAYIPNPTYGSYYWGRNSVTGRDRLDEFDELHSQAAYVQYTVLRGVYVPGTRYHSNLKRNEQMVDDSDELWYFDYPSSGTAHCVTYAFKKGRTTRPISSAGALS